MSTRAISRSFSGLSDNKALLLWKEYQNDFICVVINICYFKRCCAVSNVILALLHILERVNLFKHFEREHFNETMAKILSISIGAHFLMIQIIACNENICRIIFQKISTSKMTVFIGIGKKLCSFGRCKRDFMRFLPFSSTFSTWNSSAHRWNGWLVHLIVHAI